MSARPKVSLLLPFATRAVLLMGSACGPASTLPVVRSVEPSSVVEGPVELGKMRLRADQCQSIDVTQDAASLNEQSVIEFLKARGLPVRIERARSDLFYVEVQVNAEPDPNRAEWARLRVAVLGSPAQAGRELHEGMLGHGSGSWGVHRANIAVLGPVASVPAILRFVGKTKLSCWGVLTVAAGSEAFVVPGNYHEL